MRPESVALWPYFLLLIASVIAWGAYLHFSLKPDVIVTQSGTLLAKLAYYFVPPLIALITLYTAHSVYRGNQQQAWDGQQAAKQAEIDNQKQAALTAEEKEKQRQQFTLEVVGSGIAIESLRQMKIWELIEKAPPHTDAYVVPEKRYGNNIAYSDASTKRSEDVRQYGAFWFTEKWPIPTMKAEPISGISIKEMLAEGRHPASSSGGILAWHRFAGVDFEPSGVSDRMLPDIFKFFDDNSDAPALYISSFDSEDDRDRRLRTHEQFIVPNVAFTHTSAMRTDARVGLMFARRDRIEWLKPYATVPGDPPGVYANWRSG